MTARLAPGPELVWFRGPDAVKFLNDLISQEISHLAPGAVVPSLLLQPQGKLDFILWVLRGDDAVGLVTEDGRGDELAGRLGRYRIRVDVEIEPETRSTAIVVGEVSVPSQTWSEEDGILAADISWDHLPRELRVGADLSGIPEMGADAYAALRVEGGVPLVDVDVDENTIPQEAGIVPATISFDKGCFLGQELVARLDSRGGRVNRHLRILDFESPVPAGTQLRAGDREVGVVTTSAQSKGLALVWREVEPGDRLDADGVGATVRSIPQKPATAFTGS